MDQRVQAVMRLMEENLREELPLGRLADAVNLSPSRLHQLFRNATGTSPARHLKALRLAEAKRLLETTFLSVKEIRISVGVDDESHFTRDFRRAYGCTPTEYRKRLGPQDFAPDAAPRRDFAPGVGALDIDAADEPPTAAKAEASGADAGDIPFLFLSPLAAD
jgi:AraC-like DNA-binding protein